MSKKLIVGISLFWCIAQGYSQQNINYKNPSAPVSERVKDLLGRMSPEEKFWQLFMIPGDLDNGGDSSRYKNGIFGLQVSAAVKKGNAAGQILTYNTSEDGLRLVRKINSIQKYFVERTRLGIPIIAFDEALHGLVREGATVFPQAIALAATFDTGLMGDVARAIAEETRARGIRQVLSPVVNIASDVRWGRVEETYGEDPFLASKMGVSFVRPFEQMGIITTPKHLIANSGDGGRDSYPIHFSERFLEEMYWPPFKACILEGGSRSVMASYNSIDGSPASMNSKLLKGKLKGQLNFSGFVISDANGTGGANVLHMTTSDYAASGQRAINSGLDVIFQTEYDHYKLFIPHFLDGGIDPKRIDDAVSRVLKAKFELGLFEHPYQPEDIVIQLTKNGDHRKLARQAAQESIVLLKNDKKVLPLGKAIHSIAVIGQDATEGRLGGYSGQGNGTVTILDGIKGRAGNHVTLGFTEGCGRRSEEWKVIPASVLTHDANAAGLLGEYFNNVALSGKPALTRIDDHVDFHWTLFSPDPLIGNDFYSVRWTGKLQSPETGTFKIGLTGNDGYRLYVNNKLLIDRWEKQTYTTIMAGYPFVNGVSYDIRIEFFEPVGNSEIKLIWNVGVPDNWQTKIGEAVALARKSDVAIIVAGIQEGEFQDRAMLTLPGHQQELIQQVAATGKPVVVVLVGGSAITMNSWLPGVDAVIDAWYAGEEGGSAVADVLWGDYNPAGRLPVTFPLNEAQLPLVYNHLPTGRGDDYNNLSGLPLFPFGFGLSYTTFDYTAIRLDKETIAASDSTHVRCTVTNTGAVAGSEVVQLYIRDLQASVAQTVMALKGFQRIYLRAGESREIVFAITPACLRMLNEQMETVVEPGEFRIMIGTSSRDLRLKKTLTVK